jgi:hypothetical protein
MRRLEEITGEERVALEKKYLRAHRKFAKGKSRIDGSDLIKFRLDFMWKNKISTGI